MTSKAHGAPRDALLMTNILASRSEEWELLERNLDRIRPSLSSLIVDLWDSDATPREVLDSHAAIIDRFDQVLFLKTGRRGQLGRHLRSSLTYYRHWIACLDQVADDELPSHIIQLDARYEDALDLEVAFRKLERPDVFAVTCYQDAKRFSKAEIEEMARQEGKGHRLRHRPVAVDDEGRDVLGPWFSTRYFVIHKRRLQPFLRKVRAWRKRPGRRMEYHLCGLLSRRARLYVHEPV